MTEVQGFTADGYEGVRATFQSFLDDGREAGAGLSVWRDGEEVVNLRAGWADAARTTPWQTDTLVQPYSVSKPFAALAALVAVRDGAVTLDEPIADHWAGYGRNGKESVTLRQVLSHQAGQPRFPATAADLLDDEALRASLAAAPPEYAPGTAVGEHALTYGHLIDGVLRAAAGTTLGEVFGGVVRPALDLDGWFGVPDTELGRVAELEYTDPSTADTHPLRQWLTPPEGVLDLGRMNSRAWRQSVFGAVNLHVSASALARFYAELPSPDGPVARLLGADLHAEYLTPQVRGHDQVFETTLSWTLGFIRDDRKIAKGGLGGSAAWWSPRHDHGCAYLTRTLDDMSRAGQLAAALGDDLSI